MKPITLNKTSLLYRFLNEFATESFMWDLKDDAVDSCRLIRGIGYAVLKALWTIVLIICLTISFGDALAWSVVGLIYEFVGIGVGFLALGIIIFVGIVYLAGLISVLTDKFKEYRRHKAYERKQIEAKLPPRSTPAYVELFASWKDKYCVPVKLIKE